MRILDVIDFFRIKSEIIVNKSDLNQNKSEEIIEITRQAGSDFPGEIKYDKAFIKAQMNGKFLVEFTENKTTDQIKSIWG